MTYYIGVDGGGTKTELAAVDREGRRLTRTVGVSTNPHAVSYQAAVRELIRLLEDVVSQPCTRDFSPAGLCLGLSGVDSPQERQPLLNAIRDFAGRTQLDFPFVLLSEAEISLMASVGRPHGLLIVSGTGSIVYAVDKGGTRHRSGGWGHLLGDEGSGYAIGLRTLKAAMAAYDGTIASTLITPMILESYAFREITELKPYIYRTGIAKSDIAAFTKICIRACEQGDPVAIGIVKSEAEALAATTSALLHRHPAFAGDEAVFTGSVFRESRGFQDAFRKSLTARHPTLRFADGLVDRTPAEGAALIARQLFSSRNVRGTQS